MNKAVAVYFKEDRGRTYKRIYMVPLAGENIMKLALEKWEEEFMFGDFYTVQVSIVEEVQLLLSARIESGLN